MITQSITKKELKSAIKESIKEALSQELIKLRALILPLVSQKEQKNIEKIYGKPVKKIAKTIEIEL